MEQIFIQSVNISLTAGWLILAIFVVRLFLKKAPKWVTCLLWSLVAIRLLFPFSLESSVSMVPSAKPIPEDFAYTTAPYVNSGFVAVDDMINPIVTATLHTDEVAVSANPTQILTFVCSRIWVIGMIMMFLYAVLSTAILKYRLRTATLYAPGIKQSENASQPFVLGLLKPMIYIPYHIEEEALSYVIRHEKAHIKRLDHIWKPLGFLLLSIYWFQPLLWVAYVFLCKDIEAACDEKVVKDMNLEERRAYSTALLSCSTKRKLITACPVAFGENSVKTRIKDVMNYRKPAFWMICISVVACVIVAVCFLTNPKEDEKAEEQGQMVEAENVQNGENTTVPDVEYPGDGNVDEPLTPSSNDTPGNAQTGASCIGYSLGNNGKVNGLWGTEQSGPITCSEYQDDLIFNFGGVFFQSDLYEEPLHGDGAPRAWYSLGGIGQCLDPNFAERVTYDDEAGGVIKDYAWLDNHSERSEPTYMSFYKYYGVKYRYSFDLFTAVEVQSLSADVPVTSEYWVVFYTMGKNQPLYVLFLNCDYFSEMDASVVLQRITREADGNQKNSYNDIWYTTRDYPIKTLAQAQEEGLNYEEWIAVSNPPADLLTNMSTEELARLVLHYPLIPYMPWFSDYDASAFCGVFDGYSTIFTELTYRTDHNECMLQEYVKNVPNVASVEDPNLLGGDESWWLEYAMDFYVWTFGSEFTPEQRKLYNETVSYKKETYGPDLPENNVFPGLCIRENGTIYREGYDGH